MDSWMEADKPLITVVVPVYQTDRFLGECVESLLCQTYGNLEIILVDDGSTDGSGSLCDKYTDRDGRIQVIHQENSGPMAARKAGVDQGNGTYFAFVDSDDMVSPLYIEKLYELLIKFQADIAACAFEKNKVKFLAEHRRKIKELCMPSQQMLKRWHGRYKKFETVMWNKLYHRNVLERDGLMAMFPGCRSCEDILLSHYIVQNAEKVALIYCPLYFYRSRKDSITSAKISKDKITQNLNAQRMRMDFFWKKRYWRSFCRLLWGYLLHRMMFCVAEAGGMKQGDGTSRFASK